MCFGGIPHKLFSNCLLLLFSQPIWFEAKFEWRKSANKSRIFQRAPLMPSQALENGLLYPHNNNAPLPGANFYQDELKLVTDDVFSYMCSLAMEKCSKKSEKKKASCGGAAMRKRLLIKNFVAQMLAQDRENNSTALNGPEMDYEDSQMDSCMDVDEEEEDQEEEEEDMDEQASHAAHLHPHTSHELQPSGAPSSTYSLSSTSIAGGLYNCQTPSFYDSTSSDSSTSRSGIVDQWTDDFHTVPPTAREQSSYMLDEENIHCQQQQQQESLLYSLYPQYCTSSPAPSTPYSNVVGVGALPENLLEDISLWEEKKHLPLVDCSAAEPHLNNTESTALASLVNMVPSMIKIGCCRSELCQETAYRRCITDLDTNTSIWIRQTEMAGCVDYKCVEHGDGDYSSRGCSPRKRPHAIAANFQDQGVENSSSLCSNLMMLTSPKRVKL